MGYVLNLMLAQLMHNFTFINRMSLQAVVTDQHTKPYIADDKDSEHPSQTGECVLMYSLCQGLA